MYGKDEVRAELGDRFQYVLEQAYKKNGKKAVVLIDEYDKPLLDVYNPFSIMNAFDNMRIDDYWYRSGTPTYLAKLLEGHNVNMQKLISRPYEAGYFMDYRADGEDPFAMLYQGGYLTIKGYDLRYNEYTLDYPNNEVRSGFIALIANGYFHECKGP